MTYNYPAWLTAPGTPEERLYESGICPCGSQPCSLAIEMVRVFDAKSAECEELRKTFEVNASELVLRIKLAHDERARAEKAEAECARLREENDEWRRRWEHDK